MRQQTLAFIVDTATHSVLLGEKKTGEIGLGTLNGPGGRIEPGETVTGCVIRETKEEFGITLFRSLLIPVGTITSFVDAKPFARVYLFWAHVWKGSPTETESMIPQWVRMPQLPYDRMLSGDRHWMPRALARKRFNADVHYTNGLRDFTEIVFTKYVPHPKGVICA
jgi:8-oxo-dGTP diphosphatase